MFVILATLSFPVLLYVSIISFPWVGFVELVTLRVTVSNLPSAVFHILIIIILRVKYFLCTGRELFQQLLYTAENFVCVVIDIVKSKSFDHN